jgi:hypothetical protein
MQGRSLATVLALYQFIYFGKEIMRYQVKLFILFSHYQNHHYEIQQICCTNSTLYSFFINGTNKSHRSTKQTHG